MEIAKMTCRTKNTVTYRNDDKAIIIRSNAMFNVERGRGEKYGCWFSLDIRDAETLANRLHEVINANREKQE